jgi:hypothetical protein
MLMPSIGSISGAIHLAARRPYTMLISLAVLALVGALFLGSTPTSAILPAFSNQSATTPYKPVGQKPPRRGVQRIYRQPATTSGGVTHQ